ncbi:MAG: type II CAAX prenyl endopeptidase Rce1 family protein [Candidatus Kapaibacteriota bacterium]
MKYNLKIGFKKTMKFFLVFAGVFVIANLLYRYFLSDLSNLGISSKRIHVVVNDETKISYKIILIFFTPIVEEFLYRYGLVFSKNKTSLLLLGWIYTVYLFLKPDSIDINDPKTLMLFFAFYICLFFVLRFLISKHHNYIQELYKCKMTYIFSISVIFFAYSHFTLYSNYGDLTNILFSPIILLTYFIAGALYGFIRLKYGFVWCCLAHIMWNAYVVLN